MGVDQGLKRRDVAGNGRDRGLVNRGGVARFFDLGDQRGPFGLGDDVVGKAGVDRIAGGKACAGHADIFAEPTGRTGKNQGTTDIGNKTDAAFGHGHAAGPGHDTVRAVTANAYAAAQSIAPYAAVNSVQFS